MINDITQGFYIEIVEVTDQDKFKEIVKKNWPVLAKINNYKNVGNMLTCYGITEATRAMNLLNPAAKVRIVVAQKIKTT